MLRSFENLKLGHKLLIPITILIVTVGAILWTTQNGLTALRMAGETAIDGIATRRTLTLTIVNHLNDATIQEKNIILETDPAEKQASFKQFQAAMDAASHSMAQLAAMQTTETGFKRNAELKAMVAEYQRAADRSMALGLQGDTQEAAHVSNTAVRAARLKIVAYTNERVRLQQQEMEQVRTDLGALGGAVLLRLYLYAGIGLTVSLGLLALIVLTLVVRPIAAITASMQRLAAGDLKVEIIGADREDEVGSLAKSLMVFKANGLKAVALDAEVTATRAAAEIDRARVEAERAREAAEDQAAIAALAQGLGALASGNLTHQITGDLAPKTRQLKADFNAAAARLRDTMTTIAGAIQGMNSGTSEISQAADDLSRRTEQQAASLEQTAAALDQITTTVRTTAEGANHAKTLVSTAKSDAEQSSAVVREAMEAMGEIEKSSESVAQIIGVIDEIAFQTNLLALNAGVEAARAGDAGRGFVVVASEVRALAQRSAEAAKEIKQLIAQSSKQVERGVKLVDQTGQSLQRIVGHVAEVHMAVTSIAASAKEQATGLHEVNTAVNQMDQVTQQNAAMVEQSTAASHGLAHETAELTRLTSYFQTGTRPPRPVAMPAPRPALVRTTRPSQPPLKMVASAAVAADAEGWEEF
jgi:methyl-accepting chemotaxis protein